MACIESDPRSPGSLVDWTHLPIELLDLILSKLVLIPDYIRCGAVCKQWRSSALNQKLNRIESIQQHPPMLLIPVDGSQEHRNLCSIFEDNKVYHCPLPIPFSKRCCGASYGWWAFGEEDFSITLINPVSGKIISLPPIMDPFNCDLSSVDPEILPFIGIDTTDYKIYPEEFIRKVTLSCDPCLYPDDYVVAAIQGPAGDVGFIRSGDESWSYPCRRFLGVNDLQFYKGRLYAVNHYNHLVALDCACHNDSSGNSGKNVEDALEYVHGHIVGHDRFTGAAPMEYLITQKPAKRTERAEVSYLVESLEGELLLVQRHHLWLEDCQEYDLHVTLKFKVYKLTTKRSSDRQELEWVEIQSLGDSALFLGDNHSMCISASSFPNCKPNSIYFTDDNIDRNLDDPFEAIDMGVFHLDSEQIGMHYDLPQALRYMPPAVWLCPRLQ